MSRYIDIEPIEKEIEFELTIGKCKTFSEREKGVLDIYVAIKNVPTADVEKVRHGKWSGEMNRITYYCATCSNCGLITPCLSYCGMCGAKMYKEKEE